MSIFDQPTGPAEHIDWPESGEKITRDQFKELRAYAKERGIALQSFVDSDVDITLAKSAIDDLSKVAEMYPRIKGDAKYPLTLRLSPMESVDFANSPHRPRNVIELNRDAFRNAKRLQEEYQKAVSEGKFVEGTDYHSIIFHECGHLVSDAYEIDGFQLMKDVLGYQSDAMVSDYCKTNLSWYAGMKKEEVISECFSAYYGLAEPPQFVLDFMERLAYTVAQRG